MKGSPPFNTVIKLQNCVLKPQVSHFDTPAAGDHQKPCGFSVTCNSLLPETKPWISSLSLGPRWMKVAKEKAHMDA